MSQKLSVPCKEPGNEGKADDDKHEEENNAHDPRPRLKISKR